jgi:hypothetical protein
MLIFKSNEIGRKTWIKELPTGSMTMGTKHSEAAVLPRMEYAIYYRMHSTWAMCATGESLPKVNSVEALEN